MPPTKVTTIQDEIRTAHERVRMILDAAQRAERDVTAEEQREVDGLLAKMETLAAKRDGLRNVSALEQRLATLGSNGGALGLPRGALVGKTPGQAFVESEAYQDMIRGGLAQGPRPGLLVEVPLPSVLNETPWLSPPGGYPAQTSLPPVPPGAPILLPRTAQLFARGPAPDGGNVPYLVDASTGQAAPVAEGAQKPEVVLTLNLNTAPLQMIACYAKLSEQVLEDIAGVQQWIDFYLSNKVLTSLDAQLMAGTGVSPQLIGLVPLAGKTADRPKGATESIPDAILAQILLVETNSGLPVTGVVMAPDVYGAISTAKASTSGVYVSGTPITDSPPTLLWGRAMSVNPALAAGTAMVGSYLFGAVLRLKGGMRLAMTNSDKSDFTLNIVTVRAEIRCALAPSVPKAFGLVTGLVTTA